MLAALRASVGSRSRPSPWRRGAPAAYDLRDAWVRGSPLDRTSLVAELVAVRYRIALQM